MEKKYYIVIVAMILVLALMVYSAYSTDGYRLICENAQNVKEYTSCIRLDTLINR